MTTPRDAIGLSERLRRTTEMMACRCSVPMDLWQDHSTAALEAATQLDALSAENVMLREAAKGQLVVVNTAVAERKAAESRATRAEQQRDEALERLKPFARDFGLNDCDDRKDDDALEVSIKDLRAARDCVLRLAAGPEKEGE